MSLFRISRIGSEVARAFSESRRLRFAWLAEVPGAVVSTRTTPT